MRKSIFVSGLLALAISLFGTQCWAQTCGGESQPPCPLSITNAFSPSVTNGTFNFGPDGVISFQFETVLTPFNLTVTAVETGSITNLDPTEFPAGTICIPYSAGHCVRYDVTGNAGGPNGVPIRGINYKGLISVLLNYDSFYSPHIPAFGHAPGDNATAIFSENILTSYVDPNAPSTVCPSCDDPGMGGKIPGISSLAALDIPFAPSVAPGDSICSLTAVPQNSTSGQNPLIEVSFKLVSGNCNSTNPVPTPLRDKTATLSVATLDINGNVVFTSLVNGGDSNKFHFDNKNGVNVQDINTNGLGSGKYYVTVISSMFPPVTTSFIIP